ncbi:FUSC family protein [Catellatospora tritici]|uniref:FUSC family protein n=1 Tax=Catellatospora tritici TaxID=2851566 RepID=UPI001C2DC4DE|nr:FUSC family protein [Catellatospora tritici]MBV1854801.1 FUSC family protein [Catellatospora tritici]
MSSVWSAPAAVRAVRAAVLVPVVFAVPLLALRSVPMATYAAFGGFASLVLAQFGGTRRDRAVAHLMLTAAGAVLVVVGTLASPSVLLAALATLVVAFTSYFAAVIGPNDASGAAAAMLPFMLAASAAAPPSVLGPRLCGWVAASLVGGIAVVLTSPRTAGVPLRDCAAELSEVLADQLDAGLRGPVPAALSERAVDALHRLIALFVSTPYRPNGLVIADQAMAGVVGQLEWAKGLVTDGLARSGDLSRADATDRALFDSCARVLRQMAVLLRGGSGEPDLDRLERDRVACLARLDQACDDSGTGTPTSVVVPFYALTTAVAVRAAAVDALIARHGADPLTVGESRRDWAVLPQADVPPSWRLTTPAGIAGVVLRNASLRSVWFVNALRGAAALAAAVILVQVSDVRSGFWVLLGALSVLRTSAASTGTQAVKAIVGTAAGVAVGAALLLVVGTSTPALWVALPLSILVVAYAPGILPDVVGQAGFTVVILVLYNILAPTGWTLGLVRLQDVALGCLVSLVAGVLVWPRGAGDVVRDNLADVYRHGGQRLTEMVGRALGRPADAPPPAWRPGASMVRLEDALRGYLAEPGSKRMARRDLWQLIMAGVRLRLTADSLSGLVPRAASLDAHGDTLVDHAHALADFYDQIAAQLGRPDGRPPTPRVPPALAEAEITGERPGTPQQRLRRRWVAEHLRHVELHLADLIGPAEAMAERRRRGWWH